MKSMQKKQFARQDMISRPVRRIYSTSTLRRPLGFTLIEIMVVLVIVAILAGLLLPVIFRAQLRARETQVKVEISLLSSAVEEFKERYGIHPPSAIVLWEQASTAGVTNYFTTPGQTLRAEQRTVQLFNRIWPDFPILTCQFDFDGDGTFDNILNVNGNPLPVGSVDFNGNGVIDQGVVQLVGSECLAFFLGGMPQGYLDDNAGSERLLQFLWPGGARFVDVQRRAFQGFSRNPVFPFSRETDVYGANIPIPGANDRFTPLFEFTTRLVDSAPDSLLPDGFWEYLDPLEANPEEPYRYFSSYQGQAYNSISLLRVFNAFIVAADPTATTIIPELGDDLTRDFDTPPAPYSGDAAYTLLPYYAGAPLDQNNQIIDSQIQWFNPRSFQIISPGVDGRIGFGGRFNPDSGDGPWSGSDNRDADGDGDDFDPDFDRDNITNFSDGRLADEE